MHLTNLKIEGYRSLRNVDWQPGKLNVVIGANATGKSNLLKLLRLIRSSADKKLKDHILHEGGIGSVVWNGIDEDVKYALSLKTANGAIDYGLSLKRLGAVSNYVVNQEQLVSWLLTMNDDIDRVVVFERSEYELFSAWTINKQQLNGDELSESVLHKLEYVFVHEPAMQLVPFIEKISVCDSLHTEATAEIRRAAVARTEEYLDDGGQNLTAVLHTFYESDIDFQENIDQAMSAAFGPEYHSLAFPPAGSQQIELGIRWKSLKRPQPAAVLSDGTLRFLFLITLFSLPILPSLICVDEPETGLHPTMMRIIAEYAENAALKSQVIFTTHSAAFLDGFSKEEPPTTTVATIEDGETQLKVVDPAMLSRWLEDYTLGGLYQSHELEQMKAAEVSKGQAG